MKLSEAPKTSRRSVPLTGVKQQSGSLGQASETGYSLLPAHHVVSSRLPPGVKPDCCSLSRAAADEAASKFGLVTNVLHAILSTLWHLVNALYTL